jgi:hypothetical protein
MEQSRMDNTEHTGNTRHRMKTKQKTNNKQHTHNTDNKKMNNIELNKDWK